MTLQELSQYYKLRERLKRDEEILESLRAAACPGAQNLSGMPHAPGVRDKVGDLATEIAYMEGRVAGLQAEVDEQAQAVRQFIAGVQDDHLKIILSLRYIRGLTWIEVALVLGGRNTGSGVKSAVRRFFEAGESGESKS